MGLFDVFKKKDCEICGKEVGVFGYKKLEDGEICKDCVKLLSPWFDDRRHSTVDQIKAQLAYREENRAALNDFRPTLTIGEYNPIRIELVDGVPTRFVVERNGNYREENADIVSFKDVTSFNIDENENRQEEKFRNSQGEMVSYNPPRYEYNYDFRAEIYVNHPYFDDMRFDLNGSSIELKTIEQRNFLGFVSNNFDPMLYPEYREFKKEMDELNAVFQAGMQGMPLPGYVPQQVPAAAPAAQTEAPPAAAAPQSWHCDACGSENTGKFCAGCGSPKPEPVGPKFCPNCGAPTNGAKFCGSCGSKL